MTNPESPQIFGTFAKEENIGVKILMISSWWARNCSLVKMGTGEKVPPRKKQVFCFLGWLISWSLGSFLWVFFWITAIVFNHPTESKYPVLSLLLSGRTWCFYLAILQLKNSYHSQESWFTYWRLSQQNSSRAANKIPHGLPFQGRSWRKNSLVLVNFVVPQKKNMADPWDSNLEELFLPTNRNRPPFKPMFGEFKSSLTDSA